MSDPATTLSQRELVERMLLQRRNGLSDHLRAMAQFLVNTANDIGMSNETSIAHLNTRLFLQVHVTNVIEASQDYDQAVAAYLAARSEQTK